jgi:amidohydrolase
MSQFFRLAQEFFPYSQRLRRDFHMHPELGYQEVRTAGIVAKELTSLGLEVTTGVAETGIVSVLEGGSSGPTILLRFDMDALPVLEETGKEYASKNPGVMHACGHDGHISVGLTVAQILKRKRKSLHGQARLVFQPAEEGLGGAERIIEAGVLKNPTPDRTLALHIWNELPVGTIAIVPGPLMAESEIFQVKFTGRGGHGALPQQAVDPIAAAAQVVIALQTIVSRNISPLQSAVISVTQFQAGEAFNVIPQTAELRGTIRMFEPQVRETIISRFHELVAGIAQAMGCSTEIQIRRLTPPVVNDPILADRLARRVREELPVAELKTSYQLMVSEDMAYLMEQVPGVYMLVGGAHPGAIPDYPHHHPKFDFDESALVWASALMALAASELMSAT